MLVVAFPILFSNVAVLAETSPSSRGISVRPYWLGINAVPVMLLLDHGLALYASVEPRFVSEHAGQYHLAKIFTAQSDKASDSGDTDGLAYIAGSRATAKVMTKAKGTNTFAW